MNSNINIFPYSIFSQPAIYVILFNSNISPNSLMSHDLAGLMGNIMISSSSLDEKEGWDLETENLPFILLIKN